MNQILVLFLRIVAWIIFVGLSIEAGGLLVNFFFSLYNPAVIPKLYQKMDLTTILREDSTVFYVTYGFILIIALLKAYLFYLVVMLVTKLDIQNPFNRYVAAQILKMSIYTFSIGLIAYVARLWHQQVLHLNIFAQDLNQFWADSQAFILMSAIMYIIGIIFKKGVAIQTENDLTV